MIQDALRALMAGKDLSTEQAAAAANEIMSGEATPAQIAGFLVALRLKGETSDEITGMAQVMREKALRVHTDGHLVDVVGTGGDGVGTFNISTGAALVAAACGAKIAKHGNRAASGAYGTADVLEANGVKLELRPESVARCIQEVGMGFMFAPAFHPAMRFAGPVRRELGVRTVFNILGPLTNPAGADHQLLGVGFEGQAEPMANVLAKLGTHRSWVVRGDDGQDELSITATTQVWEVAHGKVRHFTVSPEDAGLGRASLADIKAPDAETAKGMLVRALGKEPCAPRDAVLLNAAGALVVANKVADLRAGVSLAKEAIDTGEPLALLRRLAALSQSLD